ncbi:hypothetical protein BpHYR1_022322, partial [Brachionus plicatilis]
MDALECLTKILEVLTSNQKPIFSSEKGTTEIEAQGPIFRSEKGTPGIENQESDDETKNESDLFQDNKHRPHFKNLLLKYISREIPDRSKKNGMDKLKVEFPHIIVKIKENGTHDGRRPIRPDGSNGSVGQFDGSDGQI